MCTIQKKKKSDINLSRNWYNQWNSELKEPDWIKTAPLIDTQGTDISPTKNTPISSHTWHQCCLLYFLYYTIHYNFPWFFMHSTGCGRKTWRFLSSVILAIVWGGVMQPRSAGSWLHAISVAMEQWTAQHRALVVEAYFKNGDSAVTTQRLFRIHFNIPRHCRVPCRNTIKEWVQNFRENVWALKRKPPRQNSYGTNTRKCW